MRIKLLVLALVVGFAGVTQAQGSVTLYGIIDIGLGYEKQKSTTADGMTTLRRSKIGLRNGVQSGNRWGFKGVEDLGGGLRAVFVLENGFDASTGQRLQGERMFGRQATMGMASDSWGQLELGRQSNIASKYLPIILDPFRGGFGQLNAGATLGATNMVRYDNMVLYQTPSYSGFQFGIGYSFNANGPQSYTNDENVRAITSGLRYVKGPLGVALTYDQKKNGTRGGTANTTAREWNLGATYDFSVVKVSAGIGQTYNGRFTDTYGWPGALAVTEFDQGFKANNFMVGLSAPVGGGSLLASWQMGDPRSNPDRIPSDRWEMEKFQTYSLGYTYPLSKRTNLYAYGSYAKNQGYVKGHETTLTGVGVRHLF